MRFEPAAGSAVMVVRSSGGCKDGCSFFPGGHLTGFVPVNC